VADRDATGGEDLVDMAQAERKSEAEPDGVADDLGREPMSGVAGGGGRRHPVRLPNPTLPQQAANLTVPADRLLAEHGPALPMPELRQVSAFIIAAVSWRYFARAEAASWQHAAQHAIVQYVMVE
jgi:hypothetical protein